MASKGAILLDKALHADVLERCLLSDDKSNVSKLGGKKETVEVADSVLVGTNVDVGEERKGLGAAILVRRAIGRVHVPLTDGLTLDTTEMDGFLLWVVPTMENP